MHSSTLLSIKDLKAFSKCAQLCNIIPSYISTYDISVHNVQYAKRIIRKEGDANFLIPSDYSEEDQGGTMLHIAWRSCNSEILDYLLNLGADFTIKNKHGNTALHCAFKKYSSENNELFKCNIHSYIKTMLSVHIKFANSSNPCDNNGLSHFHIACMVNSAEVVKFFLLNGVDVNQTTNNEQYPGFTPLHCAIECCSIETIEVLLKYGVDRTIKNGYGMTPLHQLLNQKIQLLGSQNKITSAEKIKEAFRNKVEVIDIGIYMFLGNNFFDKIQTVDNTGLSNLHIACAMQDISKVENLLEQVKDIDQCVKMESPVWPGYTALHFAAECNNVQVMTLLHKKGASIDMKNAKGLTALDICLKIGHVLEDIHAIISMNPEFAGILFSDNKTKLVNFLFAMQDTIHLNKFLCDNVNNINMTLPSNSPLWPGCTPLHLAVIMSSKYMEHSHSNCTIENESILSQIRLLLARGADVTRKDASGKTPLHHAFRESKNKVSDLLCYHHSSINPVDEDNLSHLHIACANDEYSNSILFEKLLSNNNIDVNICYNGEKAVRNVEPGYTPLNCLGYGRYNFFSEAKKKLIERGAKDMSSDHRYGANTLHSACDKGDVDAVQRLLELGAHVNLASKDGLTALHIAINKHFPRVAELLLQKGADLLARDDEGHTPMSRAFKKYYVHKFFFREEDVVICSQSVFAALKHHSELQKQMKKETGITMLHIACYMLDVEEVRSQLDRGSEVDARVDEDSKLWPGYTSLHVLMCKVSEESSKNRVSDVVNVITQLLLENGTDVTLANTHMDTAIHMSYNCFRDRSRTKSLFEHYHNFRTNPINSRGLSHLHVAIELNYVDVVQKFLEHGADVNQPTYFLCFPLHMALDNVKKLSDATVVRLLLNHGADVNLENRYGESAIHKALRAHQFRLTLIENLLSLGADINHQDVYCRTPLEMLLLQYENEYGQRDEEPEDIAKGIQFFLDRGCRVNVYNPVTGEGLLGTSVYQYTKKGRDVLFEQLIKATDIATANEMGRTAIHNVVAIQMVLQETADMRQVVPVDDYVVFIEKLTAFGLDVDDQDHAGQTALHIAAQFENENAVLALLSLGADVNIVDLEGKSALFNCYTRPGDVNSIFQRHILKLEYFGLTVSQFNDKMNRSDYVEIDIDRIRSEIEIAKNCNIGELPLFLGDFLSEANAVVKYSRMSESSRDVIDKYFESNCMHFKEILPILKLQHRKAMKRFRLVETISTMKDLVGFSMPALCADNILRFLSIDDLKNVVAAINFEA